MGFFGRRQQPPNGRALPADIVSKMVRFARYEIDPVGSGENGADQGTLMMELFPFASEEPERFLAELAAAVPPTNGWAIYGASRTVWELLSPNCSSPIYQDPSYKAIMDGGIEFLRSNGVPPMHVRGYEWDYWIDGGGTVDTWLPVRRLPRQDEARITNLRPGETRRVAQLTSQPDSNVILVRQREDGQFSAIIDARKSDEDPRRAQREWKSAESLHELYAQIGLAMQTPTYWYDSELEPYFPLPRPRI